jgi:hypothetical protein
MPDSDAEWFTENILRLPTPLLWENSRRQGLFWGPQVFLILLLRKAVGWKFRPIFGLRRAILLPRVAERSVPPDVLERFVPARRACQAAGLRPCFLTKPAYLGGRTVYAAIFLSEDGLVTAVAALIRTRAARNIVEQQTFVCQSVSTTGDRLVTQAIDSVSARLSPVLPGVQLLPLTPSADSSQTIAAHREHVSGRNDLVRFDEERLAELILEDSQCFFDWRVEEGLLVPLTPREVRRLSGS